MGIENEPGVEITLGNIYKDEEIERVICDLIPKVLYQSTNDTNIFSLIENVNISLIDIQIPKSKFWTNPLRNSWSSLNPNLFPQKIYAIDMDLQFRKVSFEENKVALMFEEFTRDLLTKLAENPLSINNADLMKLSINNYQILVYKEDEISASYQLKFRMKMTFRISPTDIYN